jgi:hypothetical protein
MHLGWHGFLTEAWSYFLFSTHLRGPYKLLYEMNTNCGLPAPSARDEPKAPSLSILACVKNGSTQLVVHVTLVGGEQVIKVNSDHFMDEIEYESTQRFFEDG